MRPIDADVFVINVVKSGFGVEFINRVTGLLIDTPTIEPKQGEWLFKEITDDYHVIGQCSVCKERRRIDNFCPNCGVRMKGTDNETEMF